MGINDNNESTFPEVVRLVNQSIATNSSTKTTATLVKEKYGKKQCRFHITHPPLLDTVIFLPHLANIDESYWKNIVKTSINFTMF